MGFISLPLRILFRGVMSFAGTALAATVYSSAPILSAKPSTLVETVAPSRRFLPSRRDLALSNCQYMDFC